MGIMKGKYTN